MIKRHTLGHQGPCSAEPVVASCCMWSQLVEQSVMAILRTLTQGTKFPRLFKKFRREHRRFTFHSVRNLQNLVRNANLTVAIPTQKPTFSNHIFLDQSLLKFCPCPLDVLIRHVISANANAP